MRNVKALLRKVIRYIKKQKSIILLVVIIFCFPFLIALTLKIPFMSCIDLNISDCLLFYGTSLGIFSAFLTYQHEKKKADKDRQAEVKPIVTVELKKITEELFQITIYNHSKSRLSYLYLYDQFISEEFVRKQSFRVAYLNPKVESDYNITMDYDIIGKDGYPKYIQILCEDVDKNTWDLCFYKISNGDNTYHYYLRDIEQISL